MQLLKNVPLAPYSTFQIGGPATYLTHIHTEEEARDALAFATTNTLPFFIVGKGSNLLFADKGFDGLVIINKLEFLTIEGAEVFVGSGFSYARLAVLTARKSFSGLEFAVGIPGTVGGAVVMNAGASGSETKDVLTEVTWMNTEGRIDILPVAELVYSYRSSPFQKKRRGIVLAARFHLTESKTAKDKLAQLLKYRQKTQPLKMPSAGCLFRNPPGMSAGALIEACALKGRCIGGAMVSDIHANFIVNRGGASAEEVLTLAHEVQTCVKEKTGALLEFEIHYVTSG